MSLTRRMAPPTRRKSKKWELEWQQKLRASVAQDTVQTVQDSASEILLGAVPDTILTLKQVLAYIGHVSRLIDALSATTLKELNPKAANLALMRRWPAGLRHLM